MVFPRSNLACATTPRRPGPNTIRGTKSVGQFKVKNYRVEEVALARAQEVEIGGRRSEVSKAFRVTVEGGPFPVRALPPVIWIDDVAVGFGVESEDLTSITAVTFAALWIGLGLSEAWPGALILLGFTVLVAVGRSRSQTIEIISGIGDERTRSLYERTCTATTGVLAFVLPGWWLVTVVAGEPDNTLSAVCAVFAVVLIASAVVQARRA